MGVLPVDNAGDAAGGCNEDVEVAEVRVPEGGG